MKKQFSIKIPTGFDGITTTIDIGIEGIQHMMFEDGISRDVMYDILNKSDLDNVVLKIITDNAGECFERLGDKLGPDVSICEVFNVEMAIANIIDMCSRNRKRYDGLKDANCRNIETYNEQAEEGKEMKPVVICWIGADEYLKQMCPEESLSLFMDIFRLGRATGVHLMLHSDKLCGLKKAVSVMFANNFANVGMFENDLYSRGVGIDWYHWTCKTNTTCRHMIN